VILGQQGGQIAALFGPGGALFGAFLAIAAGIAGPLVKSLTESSDLLEELEQDALETTAALHTLSGAQRELAETALLERRTKVFNAQQVAMERLAEAEERKLQKAVVRTRGGINQNADAFEEATEDVKKYETQIALAGQELERLDEALSGVDPALKQTNETLQEQIDNFGLNAVGIAINAAMADGFISKQEQLNIELLNELELLKAGAAARKEKLQADREAEDQLIKLADAERAAFEVITREQDKRFKEAKKKREKDLQDQQKAKDLAISGVRDQLFALDAENKKVFQMQKAYRMAEATISAFQAANNALAAPFPFPIPQAMAAAALTLGLANVAQIKAQSFEGGGYTGMGARAGGLDGKGGRMALVHPDETIVDHRSGGGAGITVINNVDASGAGADVDQKIKAAMTETSQQTILTIQDLIRRRRFA